MKGLVLFLGILSLAFFSQAQSTLPKNVSDSLWNLWNNSTQPDSSRLDAIDYYIRRGYLFSQPDSAFYFATLQYDYAAESGVKRSMADALNTQGIYYGLSGNNVLSMSLFEQALSLRREINDLQGMATALSNIASINMNLGDYTKAFQYNLESRAIYQQLGNKKGVALTTANLATIYSDQGNAEKAFELYLSSLSLYKEINDKKGIANLSVLIASSYRVRKEYPVALEYYVSSLKIYEELKNRLGIATTWSHMGQLYREMQDAESSLAFHLKSYEMHTILKNMPGVSIEASFIAEHYLGVNQLDSAIHYASVALEVAQQIGDPKRIRFAAVVLIKGLLLKTDFDSALTQLALIRSTTLQLLEKNYFSLSERERELFFLTMNEAFSIYFEFTLLQSHTRPELADTAFNLTLQTKGLNLRSSSALRLSILSSGDSVIISEYEEWISLRKQISVMYSNGADTKNLESRANELEKELIKNSQAFGDFDKIRSLEWKQIRDGLKEREAAVEFIHFRCELDTARPIVYAALVVRPNSEHPDVVRLCTEDDLKEILGIFQGNNLSFIDRVYGKKTMAKTELYQKVWQPLEPYLDEVKTIYYSPSGLLHKVSFAAVCKAQDIYLSDVYQFRQMSSTGSIALKDDVMFGELENFLLMGGVAYNSDTSEKEIWKYLPGSLNETENINTFLQKKKLGVSYFKADNASEAVFKEKITQSSFVHIATHGFFFPDPEQVRQEMEREETSENLNFRGSTNYANWSFVNNKNPLMRSGIVLANANDVWQRHPSMEGEDGILTAQEVSNLDLRGTKLVVLSACETGLGDIKGSEGVYGLQRAFKMAGVKYMIMSLWQVPDKETSEFMKLFYKNLLKLKDIPIAFQKTQKAMREKYDPYYWGAFVLIE